ncbi:MAG: coenzyme F420-0:L-glutamate ligase [Methanobacteriaceae archaeon]|nr:coenzyme F420-0:L-glutamate ligase [Methanobacteriaceae archaeon]
MPIKKINNSKYVIIPIKTGYIKPNTSFEVIIDKCLDLVEENDFLVISETPIAISQGRVLDESKFEPSLKAYLLAEIWSKYIWGYFLGPLLGIKKRTIRNLRNLPKAARYHKQLVLETYGLIHALKPASEAGIDLSNAPGTFVSLLPSDPKSVVEDIARNIESKTNKKVISMIIDTDATYELIGKKFTSLPLAAPGITYNLGVFGYMLGRIGKIVGPTVLAVSTNIKTDKALEIGKIAESYHKENKNNIETVYDMKDAFNMDYDEITVDMLDSVEHTPAVIVRKL